MHTWHSFFKHGPGKEETFPKNALKTALIPLRHRQNRRFVQCAIRLGGVATRRRVRLQMNISLTNFLLGGTI
jgi:hypothetical protein